jgi:hypothetical protein
MWTVVLFGNEQKYLHRFALVANVVGIAATESVGLPGAHSHHYPIDVKAMYYLCACDVGVTELPKCFWKVQYPLFSLLETPCIRAYCEVASVSWRCLELRGVELVVKKS